MFIHTDLDRIRELIEVDRHTKVLVLCATEFDCNLLIAYNNRGRVYFEACNNFVALFPFIDIILEVINKASFILKIDVQFSIILKIWSH